MGSGQSRTKLAGPVPGTSTIPTEGEHVENPPALTSRSSLTVSYECQVSFKGELHRSTVQALTMSKGDWVYVYLGFTFFTLEMYVLPTVEGLWLTGELVAFWYLRY